MILYNNIWLARNKVIFDDSSFEAKSIIISSSRVLSDFKDSNGWPDLPSPFLIGIKLKKPSRGWKVYFDGAISVRRNCLGIGVWVQSPTDDFVLGISRRVDYSIDPELAEFIALKTAISAAIEKGIKEFAVMGDALGVLQCLLDHNLCPATALPVLQDILSLLDQNTLVTPCWIGRANNTISHELAYFAKNMNVLSQSWSEVPIFIVSISAG